MMSVIGFVLLAIILIWLTLFSIAMIFGTAAITGKFGSEAIGGVVIALLTFYGWYKLFSNIPFTMSFALT